MVSFLEMGPDCHESIRKSGSLAVLGGSRPFHSVPAAQMTGGDAWETLGRRRVAARHRGRPQRPLSPHRDHTLAARTRRRIGRGTRAQARDSGFWAECNSGTGRPVLALRDVGGERVVAVRRERSLGAPAVARGDSPAAQCLPGISTGHLDGGNRVERAGTAGNRYGPAFSYALVTIWSHFQKADHVGVARKEQENDFQISGNKFRRC